MKKYLLRSAAVVAALPVVFASFLSFAPTAAAWGGCGGGCGYYGCGGGYGSYGYGYEREGYYGRGGYYGGGYGW